MGMYDTVIIPCPTCGVEHEFQSKGGDCYLRVFTLENCPDDVLGDVNRHSPADCECGTSFKVDIRKRAVIFINVDEL